MRNNEQGISKIHQAKVISRLTLGLRRTQTPLTRPLGRMNNALFRVAEAVGGYFHQDCLVDDPDWQSVVRRFRKEAPSSERRLSFTLGSDESYLDSCAGMKYRHTTRWVWEDPKLQSL